jgi:hypothetical protein
MSDELGMRLFVVAAEGGFSISGSWSRLFSSWIGRQGPIPGPRRRRIGGLRRSGTVRAGRPIWFPD